MLRVRIDVLGVSVESVLVPNDPYGTRNEDFELHSHNRTHYSRPQKIAFNSVQRY